jgi:phosphoglucomutase
MNGIGGTIFLIKYYFLFNLIFSFIGPYAKSIFIDHLKAKDSSIINCEPKVDFGGNNILP